MVSRSENDPNVAVDHYTHVIILLQRHTIIFFVTRFDRESEITVTSM